jgi:hypothetical protein
MKIDVGTEGHVIDGMNKIYLIIMELEINVAGSKSRDIFVFGDS